MSKSLEELACAPDAVDVKGFNSAAILPYGLTIEPVHKAMDEFIAFLAFINGPLYTRNIPRLESMLMPANFSSVVGEFMKSAIPKRCSAIAANTCHNGHPDLIPAGMYANNSVRHSDQGIELKGSRYLRGWQGHNPEDSWLMVFVFDSNRPADTSKGIAPRPFRFIKVVAAQLEKADWTFSGRSATSRRTITASVNDTGYRKMQANWIYQMPSALELQSEPESEVAHPEEADLSD